MTANSTQKITGDTVGRNQADNSSEPDAKANEIPEKDRCRFADAVEYGNQRRIQIKKRAEEGQKPDKRSGLDTVKKQIADERAAKEKGGKKAKAHTEAAHNTDTYCVPKVLFLMQSLCF